MKSGKRAWINFAAVLICGLIFSGIGVNLLLQNNGNESPTSNVNVPTDSRTSFYYLPAPTAQENNPLAMNAVLVPFLDGGDTSDLNLNLTAEFASAPPWVSFLFESTFHIIATYNSSGSGNGKGAWKIFPWHTSTWQNETRVQFLFNRTDFSSSPAIQGTSFSEPEISLTITGLPYSSEPGRFVVIFPFYYQGTAVSEGSFTVCPPAGFLLANSNQPFQFPNYACQGTRLPYQFDIDQSQQLTMTFENSNAEKGYSSNQTWGLVSLGIGVPAIVSSIQLVPTRKKGTSEYVELAAAIVKRLREDDERSEDG